MSQVHHCHLWQVLAEKKKKKLTVCNTGVPPKGVGKQILKATGTTVISGRLPARPITRTGRLLHTAKEKVNRLPALVDNPHVMLFNFLVAKT